jgi:hypothetical protein
MYSKTFCSTFWGVGDCSQSSNGDHNTQAKTLQKLTHPAHRSPPFPMLLLNPMSSPFGGRPRNSWVTSHYPSLTLLSKRITQYSLFLMNKREVLHQHGFSAVPNVARPFNPFGGRDDHDSSDGRFSGRAHSNAFFATRLLHLNRWSNNHRRYILPPTLPHQSTLIGSSGGEILMIPVPVVPPGARIGMVSLWQEKFKHWSI